MELSTLRYFLAVAREGSVSGAAKVLHMTQPALSRHLANLEREVGDQLYTRTHSGVELTERGLILKSRAEELVALMNATMADMSLPFDGVSGVVHIGGGETKAFGFLTLAMRAVQERYPNVQFHLYSGDSAMVRDNLIKGFYDVVVECDIGGQAGLPKKYMDSLVLPVMDEWALLMRKDDPLASKECIRPDDLRGRKVIISHQGIRSVSKIDECDSSAVSLWDWLGGVADEIIVPAQYTTPLNLRYLLGEGMGLVLTYRDLIVHEHDDVLCQRQLAPRMYSRSGLVWRRARVNRQTEIFLQAVRDLCQQYGDTFYEPPC